MNCRVCQSPTAPVMDFGKQYPVCFPKTLEPLVAEQHQVEGIQRYSLELGLCTNRQCSLVQLTQPQPDQAELFSDDYGYRSSLNEAMVEALRDVVEATRQRVELEQRDWVLDIGANDGTLLAQYWAVGGSRPCPMRVAFEPIHKFAGRLSQHADLVVHDFFPPATGLASRLPASLLGRVKIITACAMFYDLPDPNSFVQAVADLLHPEGVFVVQLGYLGDMLRYNSFDQVCHEHLEYYSLRALTFLFARHGLVVTEVQHNYVNGGSLRVFVRHASSGAAPSAGVLRWLSEEEIIGMDTPGPYELLRSRLDRIRAQVVDIVDAAGGAVDVYGASTKGLGLMQYFGLDGRRIRWAVERNEEKWGRFYGHTGIPIVSEEEAREKYTKMPGTLLALIWHFRASILAREVSRWPKGTRMLFPLPVPDVVELT